MRWLASVAVAAVQRARVADRHVQGADIVDDLEDADLVEHAHDLRHLGALRAGLQSAEQVALQDQHVQVKDGVAQWELYSST